MVICAVMLNGAVDCDEPWTVLLFDDMNLNWFCNPDEDPEKAFIRGCAWWTENYGVWMAVSNNGFAVNGTGHSTFNHEMRHLSCLCAFHDDPPEAPNR